MNTVPDPRMQGYQQPVNPDAPYERPVADNTVRSANAGGAYAESQREHYVDPMGNRVENRVDVYEDKNVSRANMRYWVARITYFVLGVLEVILLLRLIFRLLGANQDNGFVTFLYNLSFVFVAPFSGIFPVPSLGRSVFEITTLVAMLIYALIAWGIVSLGRVMFAPVLTGRQNITTTRRGGIF